ncbi:hypothetical protein HID58_006595 [Brassica napus]|uniref:Uncharacterized protein n=1 Tax=Brassica napus TaxID=3708 RepID=A0ABQ8EBV0_BRANA|nr:hypothetical protein HID58_006595 [Brassica napus]
MDSVEEEEEEDKNYGDTSVRWIKALKALDMRVAAIEPYVEKVGEDSPQDVKEKEKKSKGD